MEHVSLMPFFLFLVAPLPFEEHSLGSGGSLDLPPYGLHLESWLFELRVNHTHSPFMDKSEFPLEFHAHKDGLGVLVEDADGHLPPEVHAEQLSEVDLLKEQGALLDDPSYQGRNLKVLVFGGVVGEGNILVRVYNERIDFYPSSLGVLIRPNEVSLPEGLQLEEELLLRLEILPVLLFDLQLHPRVQTLSLIPQYRLIQRLNLLISEQLLSPTLLLPTLLLPTLLPILTEALLGTCTDFLVDPSLPLDGIPFTMLL